MYLFWQWEKFVGCFPGRPQVQTEKPVLKCIALFIQCIHPRNSSIKTFIWQGLVKIGQFRGCALPPESPGHCRVLRWAIQAPANVSETECQCQESGIFPCAASLDRCWLGTAKLSSRGRVSKTDFFLLNAESTGGMAEKVLGRGRSAPNRRNLLWGVRSCV